MCAYDLYKEQTWFLRWKGLKCLKIKENTIAMV